MPFFQEQTSPYIEPSVALSFQGELDPDGELEISTFSKYVRLEFVGEEDPDGEILILPVGLGLSFLGETDPDGEILIEGLTKRVALSFQGELDPDGEFEFSGNLALVEPTPIIPTTSTSDFEQILDIRLLINGVKKEIRSATYSKDEENLGSELEIELVETSVDTIPLDANFKFEIKDSAGWKTLLDNGKLDSRNITRAWTDGPSDTLSFSTFSPTEDKFALAPRKNIILYDPTQIEIDISDIEIIEGINGINIITESHPYIGLTLRKAMHVAFVEICGFSAIETDIPNYRINQCSFDFQQSAKDSIWSFIDKFDPEFNILPGNKLRVLNTRKNVDLSLLDEIEITEEDYESLSLSSQSDLSVDGYVIEYLGKSLYGTPSTRLAQKIEKFGDYGSENYTEIRRNRRFREYKDDNGNLLDTKELNEQLRTYRNSTLIEEINTEFHYDGGGREKLWIKSRYARLQEFPSGLFSLFHINTTSKQNFHKTNPFAISKNYLSSSVTNKSGLYTIDESNPQLGESVIRDYEMVERSKNLVPEMTVQSGSLQTRIETFIPISKDQVRVYLSGTDNLNGRPLFEPLDEIRSGDISSNIMSQPLKKVLWKTGVNPSKGRTPQSINIDEMPLFFGIPLVQYILDNPHQYKGSIPIPGYNRNLEKGQYFNAVSRGENLGAFIIKGFRLVMENLDYPPERKITSVITVKEI